MYESYWNDHGFDLITPRNLDNPEGFDVGAALHEFIDGTVYEVGSGTGRIAKFFDPAIYTGMDINHNAVDLASRLMPDYTFKAGSLDTVFDDADYTLFYTVLLHVPDDLIDDVVQNIRSDKVLVCEIMNPKYRKESDEYTISNQRDLETYQDLFDAYGFKLSRSVQYNYAYYKNEKITFALFERVK